MSVEAGPCEGPDGVAGAALIAEQAGFLLRFVNDTGVNNHDGASTSR